MIDVKGDTMFVDKIIGCAILNALNYNYTEDETGEYELFGRKNSFTNEDEQVCVWKITPNTDRIISIEIEGVDRPRIKPSRYLTIKLKSINKNQICNLSKLLGQSITIKVEDNTLIIFESLQL